MKMPAWLYQRTRLLNILHFFKLSDGHSQMNEEEKTALQKYALGKKKALEIGTYMGVSANLIGKVLAPEGKLFCIDPFLDSKGSKNPGLIIAERELRRNGLAGRVSIIKAFSSDQKIKNDLPGDFDFIFIDGDHSYEGLKNDWGIVREKLRTAGIVCLHDTIVPPEEQYRNFGSVKFFEDVVVNDKDFLLIDQSYSMTVLKKIV